MCTNICIIFFSKLQCIYYEPCVNRGHPFFDLHSVRVSLLDEAVGQLRQQAHALAGLPRHAASRRRRRRAASLLRFTDPLDGRAGGALEQRELLTLLQALLANGPML